MQRLCDKRDKLDTTVAHREWLEYGNSVRAGKQNDAQHAQMALKVKGRSVSGRCQSKQELDLSHLKQAQIQLAFVVLE